MTWYEIIFRLFLAIILSGIIGLERSSLNKPAGFGTHAIIGTTAVLVVLLSEYMAMTDSLVDMSRIPAQLLSGIGFIGAGTILRNGLNVKGVTTAAGILAVTCIGMAVGAGFYFGAIIVTIIVFLTLAYSHKISDKFERYNVLDIEIKINGHVSETLTEIEKYLNNKKVELKGIKRPNKDEKELTAETVEILGTYEARYLKINNLISDLIAMEHVTEVSNAEE